LIRTVDLPSRPISVCSRNNEFFVSVAQPNGSVFGITRDGPPAVAFSLKAPPGLPAQFMQYADRRLWCDSDNDVILDYSPFFPTVTAHRQNGAVVWEAELPNFRGPSFKEVAPSVWQVQLASESTDRIINAFGNHRFIGVQSRHVFRLGDAEDPANIPNTFLLDIGSGKLVRKLAQLPPVALMSENVLYLFEISTSRIVARRVE